MLLMPVLTRVLPNLPGPSLSLVTSTWFLVVKPLVPLMVPRLMAMQLLVLMV